jgi:acyl-CoA hydrolase
MGRPAGIESILARKRGPAESVLAHIEPGDDLIVGLGNAEPATVIDAIEAAAETLADLRLHQMLPLRERRYIDGEFDGVRHVSWFLSPQSRRAYANGKCDLVPNNFSDVPSLLRRATKCSLVLAAAAPPDRHG